MSCPGQEMISGHTDDTSFSLCRPKSTAWIIAVLVFVLWMICFPWAGPARADGGGPQPTSTTLAGAQSAPTPLPGAQPTPTSLPGIQSAPTPLPSTPEVKSFEIVIDSNRNATVQQVTPDSQAALSRAETLEAQASSSSEEKFSSPLWIFGFFTLVIIILMLNSVSRGIRNRA